MLPSSRLVCDRSCNASMFLEVRGKWKSSVEMVGVNRNSISRVLYSIKPKHLLTGRLKSSRVPWSFSEAVVFCLTYLSLSLSHLTPSQKPCLFLYLCFYYDQSTSLRHWYICVCGLCICISFSVSFYSLSFSLSHTHTHTLSFSRPQFSATQPVLVTLSFIFPFVAPHSQLNKSAYPSTLADLKIKKRERKEREDCRVSRPQQ